MMRKSASFLACALVMLCLLVPASASTWRSKSGNIFNFYPDGSMKAYWAGVEHDGYWWWVQSNHKFGYSVGGSTCTVTMEGAGAVCRGPGPVQYWTLMSTRGDEQDQQEPADTKSWFWPRVATPTPAKL